jgi:DNA adenine methylase
MDSFIGWIGGKKLLRNEIVKRFPEKIDRYIEVCGGAAWVLFHKDKHANIEIYNDVNGNLVNLYKCIKYHCPELQRELSFVLNSREMFEDFKAQYNIRGMTEIQKAARFFMLLKISYGSNGRSYGCVKKDIKALTEYLTQIEKRLSSVIIENKDFEDLLKVYDKPNALSYLDPPYYGTERYYDVKFTLEDHIRLNRVLKSLKGKFLLSYNDCEPIREMYKDFTIEEISRSHNLVSRYSDIGHNYKELLIRNY